MIETEDKSERKEPQQNKWITNNEIIYCFLVIIYELKYFYSQNLKTISTPIKKAK